MTKEELHLNKLIQTSGITIVKNYWDFKSSIYYSKEKIYKIVLGLDNSLKVILINFYHELGHYNFLLNKTFRKFMVFIVGYNRFPKLYVIPNHWWNKFVKVLCTFLTYLWEMLAWWYAKKELQKTEFWNLEMRKTFAEYKKRCLNTYLGYKFK